MTSVHDFKANLTTGEEQPLSIYKGKVLLIVNVASKCGFTPQYKGLQEMYDKYRDQGFEVLAFPCNQFKKQEPGTNEEVCRFARDSMKVTFPIFEKVDVNGSNAHPLWAFLQKEQAGFLFDFIKWNFTKILVDRDGKPMKRYAPTTEPASFEADVEAALKNE